MGEDFFFSPIPVHSDWYYLGTLLVPNTKGKNERKRKEKKKEHPGTMWSTVTRNITIRRENEDVWFFCERREKSCMFILLKITRLGISETRQIEHVVKIWIYRSSFRNNLRYWYAMLRSLYFNCTETIFIYIEKLLDEIIIIKNQHIIILKFAISLFINSM